MGESEEAEVKPAVVSKSYRRKNIGKKLMETVITEANNRGVRIFSTKPVVRNVEAFRFLTTKAS